MSDNKFSELEIAFFNDGYRLAVEYLYKGINIENFNLLLKRLYEYTDSLVNASLEQCQLAEINVDCKKGCSFCCHQSIWVLPYEIYHMYEYIKANFSAREKSEMIKKTKAKAKITSGLTANEFLHYKHPCPLLVDGACSVYPSRPIACRIYLSMEVNSCKEEFNNSKNLDLYAKLVEFPLKSGQMINEGICKYLQHKGIYINEWLLEIHLKTLIENENSFAEWIQGKKAFNRRALTAKEEDYINMICKKN